ncbi:conserved hypothetical protein [Vibrio nigripulchritudo SO65]|uniref:hypothetical protein n=1 Tax=Vibrio nigripulchritudo TaxID=28173 RepID=UPI0003B1B065|nr:hypothetical protein [Vibrio nigripulchritudo]CCN34031.1 conserved hypothetical protein [Vibrio nigripulchritudo AM115]CCN39987.1 conserved hypothetical protein [Vibrio nigripulchritudo FTn2]CCN68002.1 conserved hypothetical protein [Vibrio nigripulchritudo POn4]CCN76610.1 conserved hypothetical protein [Vibrio nigripulchritudo SO65]
MSIESAIEAISKFQGNSLTESLSRLEEDIIGASANDSLEFCSERKIDDDFVASALAVKKVAGEINVIIHASGILHSLKDILKKGEVVQSVSLGAGNTGRKFDLETNLQVAEFKFIDWKGGAESIRQNGLFKDFYELAEYDTEKAKSLYVVGTHYPLKFLNGRRALTSVLSKQPAIYKGISGKYGSAIKVVRDYYEIHKSSVRVIDISPYIGRV